MTEVSELTQVAAERHERRAPGRIMLGYYGTLKYADSPVLVKIPARLVASEPLYVMTLELALAIQEAYETTFETVANLRKLEEGLRSWQGSAPGLISHEKEFQRWLHREGLASELKFPKHKTTEEKLQDYVGYLSAVSQLGRAPKPTSYDYNWMEEVRFFTRKRFAIDSVVLASTTGFFTAVAVAEHQPAIMLFTVFGALATRFRSTINRVKDVTLLEYTVYEDLPGKHAAKRWLAEEIVRGISKERLIGLAADAKRDQLVREESERLAQKLTDKISPLSFPTDNSPLALPEATTKLEHANGWELLQAQRQLLEEVKERKQA